MSEPQIELPVEDTQNKIFKIAKNALLIAIVMFGFLVSLKLMGASFKGFGKESANFLIANTRDPFVGLVIGLLATAIIQSSSTTTTIIVGLVASGNLTLEGAVPMLMGANIGTSVTSTIVSMSHIGKRKEFRKAISAATIHDFFNIMVVILLFPLELSFGALSKLSRMVGGTFTTSTVDPDSFDLLDMTVKPVSNGILWLCGHMYWVSLIVALLMLGVSLHYLTKLLKKLLIGKAQEKLDSVVFRHPVNSLIWGTFITAGVQSSSVTSSLVVPLVATNKISLRKAFPFLMGANIGTTVTALIASMSDDNPGAAVPVALAHLFFNVIGVAVVFPIKPLRDLPVKLSRRLGRATLKNRLVGFAYVGITFFILPLLLILVSRIGLEINEYKYADKRYVMGVKNEVTDSVVTYKGLVTEAEGDGYIWKRYNHLKTVDDALSTKPDEKLMISVLKEGVANYGKEDMYMFTGVGYGWDQKDEHGKYHTSVDSVGYNMLTASNYKCDTFFVFKKQYYFQGALSGGYTLTYVDKVNKLWMKREYYNANGIQTRVLEMVMSPENDPNQQNGNGSGSEDPNLQNGKEE